MIADGERDAWAKGVEGVMGCAGEVVTREREV